MSYCKFCGEWQVYVASEEPCRKCGKPQSDPNEIAWYCSACGKFDYLGADKALCPACERKQGEKKS